MRTIATAAVVGLLIARVLAAQCHAGDPETTPKRQLDKLLETYKSYGLPLPPAINGLRAEGVGSAS